jgi:hypothetical protein
VSKETQSSVKKVKRDPIQNYQRGKREVKETTMHRKRPTIEVKETLYRGKRDLI